MEAKNVRNPKYLNGNVENTHLATFSTGMLCANVNLKRESFLFYRVLYVWLPWSRRQNGFITKWFWGELFYLTILWMSQRLSNYVRFLYNASQLLNSFDEMKFNLVVIWRGRGGVDITLVLYLWNQVRKLNRSETLSSSWVVILNDHEEKWNKMSCVFVISFI